MEPKTLSEIIRLWTVVKPIKKWKNRRARKKAEKTHLPVEAPFTDEEVDAEVKQVVSAAPRSWTMRTAAFIVAVGVWIQTNPEVIDMIPEKYRGVAVAVLGLAVAIARMRTLGR